MSPLSPSVQNYTHCTEILASGVVYTSKSSVSFSSCNFQNILLIKKWRSQGFLKYGPLLPKLFSALGNSGQFKIHWVTIFFRKLFPVRKTDGLSKRKYMTSFSSLSKLDFNCDNQRLISLMQDYWFLLPESLSPVNLIDCSIEIS
jgi:hypothetical protein